jgi:hypothetical protein
LGEKLNSRPKLLCALAQKKMNGKGILHIKQWRMWVLYQTYAQFEADFLERVFQCVEEDQPGREQCLLLQEADKNFQCYFQSHMMTPSFQGEATPMETTSKEGTKEEKGFSKESVEMLHMAMISINMSCQPTSNSREWSVTFEPNVAVFFRRDVYRIPSKELQNLCNVLDPVESDQLVDEDLFQAFQKKFEAALQTLQKSGKLCLTFKCNRQQVEHLQTVMHLFLINDLLRVSIYDWCLKHKSAYIQWKSNIHHPFGLLLHSIHQQFPFAPLHTQFSQLDLKLGP